MAKAFREVKLVLPMEANREVEASETASEMAASVDMHPDKIDEVRMAVLEACINAFEHSLADDGKVYVTISLRGEEVPEEMHIVVQDHGVGFSEEDVQDTISKPGGLPRKRGWGLTIIHRLMDEVEVATDQAGTVVIMRKRI